LTQSIAAQRLINQALRAKRQWIYHLIRQPRKQFNEETIKELAASIEQHGLIQPISVIPVPESDSFVIVAGERRYRAHQHLERPTITAIITKGNSNEIALIENIQREDLSPMDQTEVLRV
jgi:ParB family chromosome partitioning protein